jgi:hypothetical protein
MPALMKKSKAILSAVSLVFCSFAAADTGIGIRENQNVDLVASKAIAVSGHVALQRVRSRKTVAGQGRASRVNVFAVAPVRPFVIHLPSEGLASCVAFSSYDLSCERSASARAPPLS